MSNPSYFDKANENYIKGSYPKALSLYKKSIEAEEYEGESYYNSGVCLIKLERFNEAIKAFEMALRLNNKEYKCFFNLGYCYGLFNEYKKAYLNFNVAWALNKDDENCEKAIKLMEEKLREMN